MFSLNSKRFFTNSCKLLTRFKVYPAETAVRNQALVESIAESQDKAAFFAWHPKKPFPYELTRPLPVKQETKSQSVLKEEAIEKAQTAFSLKRPEFSRAELARLTFTTVHRWFPKARSKKWNYKKTPMDRKYL